MNLQALYDLKERLEYAAIAGTGLLQEDFRLRRAVEAMAPLAGASPVFGKISAAAKALLAAPQSERGVRLLDLLSLVDAVVYTQGLSNISGDLIPREPGTGTYVDASYGQLQPLLTALTGTGSGRMNLIRDMYTEHPAYFSDYRVLPHVVKALGESYTELADLIAAILMKQGRAIIPMLKAGFDPAGKAETARRVRLIIRLAGADENDWYVRILPDSKKEIREAVIQALSLSQDNAGLLLDLCRSERGKLKEAALRSLAMMDDPACAAHLQKELGRKNANIGFLRGVGSILAADFAAASMQKRLETLLAEPDACAHRDLDALAALTEVIAGKYSPDMARLWHWIARHMEQFAAIVPGNHAGQGELSAAEHLQKTFLQTILWDSRPEMIALARDLAAENREWFLCGSFLADMAESSAGALYEKYAPLIVRCGPLTKETPSERSDRIQIMKGLSAVRWSQPLHGYAAAFSRFDPVTGNAVISARRLDGVDPRWLRLLTDPAVHGDGAVYDLIRHDHAGKVEPAMDWIISWLIDGDDPEVCQLAGAWLYRWTWVTGQFGQHFADLVRCGWKDWKGLLTHCVARQGSVSYYGIMDWIPKLPVSNAEKAEELRQLDQLVRRKEVKVNYGHWPQMLVASQIAALEADPSGEY